MKNIKGDVPITILVIGVVVICALAILSFLSSSLKSEQSFIGVSTMEEMNSRINEYYFYRGEGLPEEEFFYLEHYRPRFFREDEFLFSVKYVLP